MYYYSVNPLLTFSCLGRANSCITAARQSNERPVEVRYQTTIYA